MGQSKKALELFPDHPEIFSVIAEQGHAPIGPPFAQYRIDEGEMHVTAGVPVDGLIEPRGRVESGELPAGEIVPVRINGAMVYDLSAVPDSEIINPA